jgi:hypothetical protein
MTTRRITTRIVRCGGCGQSLDLTEHSSAFPSEKVPDAQVSWAVRRDVAGYCLMCPCGHYTVVAGFERSTQRQ